ncbi:uncharacterized protein AMSG_10105 [Thecamonas trahens ATCC 50062]|uniref:Myb-like domain-containing protein n=1 Tax=Thecamonas trahens ATCC 50062 TaxID=461836 RepID=A0A0L0DQ41_THETB|nr:hypothetical protein AMSG_10105 [Thecamonas trahens ATCC 50062]KNC54385.1 hypothetical protein AMSG_10105 [Thecamonas trahens ATCC 50062]|eukprot:XP_013753684.1 hypothetical protein AMSG_10105 [Thecamonas trahens ATCC 50062]
MGSVEALEGLKATFLDSQQLLTPQPKNGRQGQEEDSQAIAAEGKMADLGRRSGSARMWGERATSLWDGEVDEAETWASERRSSRTLEYVPYRSVGTRVVVRPESGLEHNGVLQVGSRSVSRSPVGMAGSGRRSSPLSDGSPRSLRVLAAEITGEETEAETEGKKQQQQQQQRREEQPRRRRRRRRKKTLETAAAEAEGRSPARSVTDEVSMVSSPSQAEAYYDGERNAAGRREGFGVYAPPGGGVYEGEWRNGKREGQGSYRWPDGRVYVGGWNRGRRDGIGMYYDGSSLFRGRWERGVAQELTFVRKYATATDGTVSGTRSDEESEEEPVPRRLPAHIDTPMALPVLPSIWSPHEQAAFVRYFPLLGKDWYMLSSLIPTRTPAQIRRYYREHRAEDGLSTLLCFHDGSPRRGAFFDESDSSDEHEFLGGNDETGDDEHVVASDFEAALVRRIHAAWRASEAEAVAIGNEHVATVAQVELLAVVVSNFVAHSEELAAVRLKLELQTIACPLDEATLAAVIAAASATDVAAADDGNEWEVTVRQAQLLRLVWAYVAQAETPLVDVADVVALLLQEDSSVISGDRSKGDANAVAAFVEEAQAALAEELGSGSDHGRMVEVFAAALAEPVPRRAELKEEAELGTAERVTLGLRAAAAGLGQAASLVAGTIWMPAASADENHAGETARARKKRQALRLW